MRDHACPRFPVALPALLAVVLALTVAGPWPSAAAAAPPAPDWPRVPSPVARDDALEARVAAIVSGMTLAQKVGQMTQAEIGQVQPDDVRRYYLGSVLNGGGSWPADDKHARVADWLALAQRFQDASMATDLRVKVPLIWGTDAVHGHNNVYGATIFPHNIGLGAANDPALVTEIGGATARAVRATGIRWVFAPTLAVARDDRWGRTYESFSEDPALVRTLGGAYVRGLQGTLGGDGSVVATAKHFMGDGGTEFGRDQGVNRSTRAEMIALHAQGYVGALGAGVQTVMASFNSWNEAGGQDHGKMHGSRLMLTEVLKGRMGFDGFVVSDWNGIGQVPGCRNDACAAAINAGIDMVMVPEQWKSFIANTIAQVKRGEIPMARIDDAVTRILRVKMRAGLFAQGPSQGAFAGHPEALLARDLARRAVRESLVLLKNNRNVLPLARGQRLLVVGRGADSLEMQTGGWSLSWQGRENPNGDFPAGDTILAGLREAARDGGGDGKGDSQVVYSERAADVDVSRFDAVVAVVGESPYAEGQGDIPRSGTLRHADRHPEDLAVLRAVAGKGVPVITVLLSGRALQVNELLDLSDAFVAAWLPGTEGKGVADVLLRTAEGRIANDFRGKLSFSWPRGACDTPLNEGDPTHLPLFRLGFGLSYADRAQLGPVGPGPSPVGCGATREMVLFDGNNQAPFRLFVEGDPKRWPASSIGDEVATPRVLPASAAGSRADVRVTTVQMHTQQDARLVQWTGLAHLVARAEAPVALDTFVDGALVFDVQVRQAPRMPVTLAMDCSDGCRAEVDLTRVLHSPGPVKTLKIPLACLAANGLDLARVDRPFDLATTGPFAAAFTRLRIVAGAGRDADALACAAILPPLAPPRRAPPPSPPASSASRTP